LHADNDSENISFAGYIIYYLLRYRIETQHHQLNRLGLNNTPSSTFARRWFLSIPFRTEPMLLQMKPITVQETNREQLEELGRASVQVVHDLKNQLNGLKLYATFLRKRLQRQEAAADELETIEKLMAGLERATADATVLVHYGRPLELKRQPPVLTRKVLQTVLSDDELTVAPEASEAAGSFDMPRITEAFRHITERARAGGADSRASVVMTGAKENGEPRVQVEWRGVAIGIDENPFTSFAGGSGLRLALARRIVEAHGGSVSHTGDSLLVVLPTG
jgi:signal transduction histidine kinase